VIPTMKLPLSFNKQQDLLALKWLAKACVVYFFFQWLWNLGWVEAEIAEPYTRVLAWELENILRLLGYDVARNQSFLTVAGFPYAIKIIPRCLGFMGGGFFIFLSVVLTLPSPSLRARVFWLIVGSLVLSSTNLLRITIVILISFTDPSSFELVHKGSIDVNTLVGGILALLAVRSLSLSPMGIKVFRRSPLKGAAEAGGASQGKQVG
jgi:exosortase/archaeosortase family protein